MRNTLLIVLLQCCFFWASAQLSISIEPAVISGEGSADNPDIEAYTTVTNNSATDVYLLWERTVDAPEEWLSWICDINNCYLPHVSTCPESQPNILAPGASMEFQVHVKPQGVEGEATITVDIMDLTDPETVLGTVQSSFTTVSTSTDDLEKAKLKIFPNPTSQYFEVADGDQVGKVIVYNIIGNPVRTFNAAVAQRYNVGSLPQGIYLVRLFDKQNSVIQTTRLSKR